jgi:hypothetical protein
VERLVLLATHHLLVLIVLQLAGLLAHKTLRVVLVE